MKSDDEVYFYRFVTYEDGYWNPIGSGFESLEVASQKAWEMWGSDLHAQSGGEVIGYGVEECGDGVETKFHPVPGLPFVHPTKFHYLDKTGPMPAAPVIIPRK